MLASGEIDAVAVTGYFGGYALYSHDYVRQRARGGRRGWSQLQREHGITGASHTACTRPTRAARRCAPTGLAVFERTEQAVRALARS